MKTLRFVFALMLVFAAAGFAADIDGKWVSERKMTGQDGTERTVTTTFEFKADGNKLTGTATQPGRPGGDPPPPVAIQDGKIDGNKISFTVVRTTQRGEMKSTYSATVEGKTLKGTMTMMDRDMPFEAKKQ
jgi:hypothetical protein